MTLHNRLAVGVKIARAEWTRYRRERGPLLSVHAARLILLGGGTLALGWGGYSLGETIIAGNPVPRETVTLFVSSVFLWLVWWSSKLTQVRFERLEPDLLVTTVPISAVSVGLLGFVAARVAVTLAGPTLGLAVGTAIGLGSPTAGLSMLVASATMAGLTVALGTVGRLAARLLALQLTRISFYRDLVIVFGWIPLLIAGMVVQEFSLAPVLTLFERTPVAWFGDLALLGTTSSDTAGPVAVSGVVLSFATVSVLTAGMTPLIRRLWEHTPADSSTSDTSYAFHEGGIIEWTVGSRISRGVYTVARKQWLMERRIPRGLLTPGYQLLVLGVVGVPLVLFVGAPETLLVVFGTTVGVLAGTAFGASPVGKEYRALPMTLTATSGHTFVRGVLLAGGVTGTPLVLLVVVPLGLAGPISPVETILVALLGSAVTVCTAAIGLAIGLDTNYDDYRQTPFFFTDVPVYARRGWFPLVELGALLGAGLLVSLPALVGTTPRVYSALAATGIPEGLTQSGSLLVSILIASGLAMGAYRRAVRRFQTYQIQ